MLVSCPSITTTTTAADERTESGAQPLTNADDSIILAVNGEIYNHRLIRKTLKTPYHFKTHSDCEVVIPLVRLIIPTSHKKAKSLT